MQIFPFPNLYSNQGCKQDIVPNNFSQGTEQANFMSWVNSIFQSPKSKIQNPKLFDRVHKYG
ncbi:hypothetical protein B4U84_12995 [Westiellopsis prolifica IICB1]|nr:hypothetical protein B4U84_12995 [Westiellopsis prolifica IICB1]